MDPSNAQMRPYSAACDEPNRPPSATPVQKPPVGDVKPRLTKDQHDLLEQHFLTQHKPTTSVKKAFAEKLNVPLDKINNWFQNRRAKVKQDRKKMMNQLNMQMGMYRTPPVMPGQFPDMHQQQLHQANMHQQHSQHSQHSQHPQQHSQQLQQHQQQHPQLQQQHQHQQQQQQQQQHQQLQQLQQNPHMPMHQEYFPVTADISPTSLPVQSVEGPSALDLGQQVPMQQSFDLQHSLRSIPEADRAAYHPNVVMHSLMAATAGAASYMQHGIPVNSEDQGFSCDAPGMSYNTSNLPNTFSNDLGFSVPATLPNESLSHETFNGFTDYGSLDYCNMAAVNTNGSGQNDVQNSTGTISSEPSPYSGAQSSATPQSSNGPTPPVPVASITSMYSGWQEEPNPGAQHDHTNDIDDFSTPYGLAQASASDQTLPFWSQAGSNHGFPPHSLYQHLNSSAHAILSSPEQNSARTLSAAPDFDAKSNFGDDSYGRRNSSTSNLASNIEAIHIRNGTPDEFKQPDQPSSIAARRQMRPVALNSTAMRSASYTPGMPSPGANPDHTLRRIRSTGIPNAAGRIQKTQPGSAQRSPMAISFSEAAASPKFARAFSSSSTTTLGQNGNLAPPTPLTPQEMGFYWQSNPVIRNPSAMPEHSSPESFSTAWSAEPQSAGVFTKGSPPSTPLDLQRINQARLANESLYRDSPPQSAPATQQNFPRTSYMQPTQLRAGFHSSTDLTLAQPKPSHFRRPSLPDTAQNQADENSSQYYYNGGNVNYDGISLNGIAHNVPFAPPVSAMPDFLVHQYTPPQGTLDIHGNLIRRTEPQPKSYIFANQGPGDFRS